MFLLKVKNFFRSLIFHIGAGLPKSTQQLINERYEICKTCPNLQINQTDQSTTCGICGCYLSTKKQFFNKLAWRDQQCPENKW